MFEEAFKKYYKDIIELHLTNDIDDMSVARVDPQTGEVVTKSGAKFKAAVANIIPDQHAGDLQSRRVSQTATGARFTAKTSSLAKSEFVYVLGDSSAAAEMPKSAFSANSQAKVVADILADLTGPPHPEGALPQHLLVVAGPRRQRENRRRLRAGRHQGQARAGAEQPLRLPARRKRGAAQGGL